MAEVERIDRDGWAEIVLNRPARRNAINGPLGERLADAFRAANADDGVQAVLFRGAEGAFCSGLDLKGFNADPPPEWLPRFNAIWRAAHKAIFDCQKPIVAALERYAINGGAALALAADLLIAGETAFLQVGEVKMGMAAPYNMAWLRLRHSENVAAKLTITGRRFPGANSPNSEWRTRRCPTTPWSTPPAGWRAPWPSTPRVPWRVSRPLCGPTTPTMRTPGSIAPQVSLVRVARCASRSPEHD